MTKPHSLRSLGVSKDDLIADLERISNQPYEVDDSERNHQAFARSHLRIQRWIEMNEKAEQTWFERYARLQQSHIQQMRYIRELEKAISESQVIEIRRKVNAAPPEGGRISDSEVVREAK